MTMKPLSQFTDIHSHHKIIDDKTIINLNYNEDVDIKGFYSIGIHPWHTSDSSFNLDEALKNLKEKAEKENIVAIGECGIDKLRGADLDIQKQIFEQHIVLSESLNKPLIIHAVKSFDEIIRLKKLYKPKQAWIIHGFRGNSETASMLLKNGFFLSFGEHFNNKSVCIVPNDCIYYETDESNLSITDIYNNIESIRKNCQ